MASICILLSILCARLSDVYELDKLCFCRAVFSKSVLCIMDDVMLNLLGRGWSKSFMEHVGFVMTKDRPSLQRRQRSCSQIRRS